ncbi:hypothetical protein GBAR_LOCUS9469 [Geodia barretti]|uniref:Uncharacterized protein n=1 Tax=Geodia barretti TaxID=519541 RepID=A0AA35RPB8_GEOBA|nr:hypothetical protein GBAR_LOCUS9469 [Geodia barretti]
MGALKEYAGVITAAVTVFAALGALGLWAVNVQVTPELNRLEGRIEQLDGKHRRQPEGHQRQVQPGRRAVRARR